MESILLETTKNHVLFIHKLFKYLLDDGLDPDSDIRIENVRFLEFRLNFFRKMVDCSGCLAETLQRFSFDYKQDLNVTMLLKMDIITLTIAMTMCLRMVKYRCSLIIPCTVAS